MYREQVMNIIKNTSVEQKADNYEKATKKYLDMMEVATSDNELILPYFTTDGKLDFKYRTYTGLFVENLAEPELDIEVKRKNLSVKLAQLNTLIEKKTIELKELERQVEDATLLLLTVRKNLETTKTKLLIEKDKMKKLKRTRG